MMLTRKNNLHILMSILMITFAISTPGSSMLAQEFRIESEIYLGDDKTPVSQNLTLFSNNMIYDFQMSNGAKPEPVEIVIYDMREKYFVLIDLAREQRIRLEQVQVIQMVEGLRQQTSQSEMTKFLLTEEFEEDFDVTTGWAELKSPSIEYRFHGGQPADVASLPTYYEFLDQFTRLKASDPTQLPPFPRLQLNQSLRKLGWFPTTVEVKLNTNELFKTDIRLSSKHTWIPNLSEKDRERIKQAKNAWMSAKKVDLRTYRHLERTKNFLTLKPEKTGN